MVTFDEDKHERKLKQLRNKEEEELVRLLAKKHNLDHIDLTSVPVNTDALRLVSEKQSRSANVAVFNKVSKNINVAVRSPARKETQTMVEELEKRGFIPTLFVASTKSLEFAWDRYKDLSFASESKRGLLDVSSEDIAESLKEIKTIDQARDFIEKTLKLKKGYRVSRIVEVFLASALATNASDVHIEPGEKAVRLRFRLDGILTDITVFDRETYRLLRSRIKLLSGLKLNVQKEPQDGRFSIQMGKANIEIRTSVLPGEYGESIVMRILNPDAISVSIEELGMEPELLSIIEHEIRKPNGMVLTTGPTGSGKTTTLYSFLKKVHISEVKIITIEDPIEYHLPGIVQTQADESKKYSFADGLRASLRQDPDVIMVGEIRDKETAEIAIHAALTGHIVFSTLHTNNAAGAFPRLIDLGINPKIISSAMNISIAQRLVRKLCDACKKEVALEGEDKKTVESILASVHDEQKIQNVQREKMWTAGTCSACGGSGYKGRTGVFEAVLIDDVVEQTIRSSPSEREIQKAAEGQGIFTIQQDGILKVLRGITTLEEVERVVHLEV